MSTQGRCVEVYDRTAEVYDSLMKLTRTTPTYESLINMVPLELPAHPNILDIGCGTGVSSKTLSNRFPDARITGLDASTKMLAAYHKRFPKNTTIHGDFNNEETFMLFPRKRMVKLEPGSFDMVVSSSAVSEYGELKKVIPLIHRLLPDGGTFLNLGIKENPINRISGKVWKFKPASEKRFINACEEARFRKIDAISIPTVLFPTNLLKYAVKAVK